MAAREAAVKVTLQNGDVLASLRQVSQETERTGKHAQQHLSHGFQHAAKEAKQALREMGEKAKEAMSLVAGVGGALGFAEGAHGAVELREKLTDLAYALESGTGKQMKWNDLQKEIAPIAMDAGQRTADLADAYRTLFEATGNAGFAKESLEPIATLATASGKSVQELAGVAGVLGEKFQISGKQMPEALTKVMNLAEQGGVQFEDLKRILSLVGASAKSAGLGGAEGLERMTGMINVAGHALGSPKKGITAITGLLDQMASPEMQQKIARTFGIKITDMHGQVKELGKIIEDVFAHGGTKREKLRAAFSDEQVKFLTALAGPYEQTIKETGNHHKEAAKALDTALMGASEGGMTFEKAQERAAERMDEPQRRMQQAMEHLEEVFTRKEMMDAMDKLAETIPKVVEALAPFLEKAAEHPAAAAAVAVGGKVGMDVGLGMLGGALKKKFFGGAAAAAAQGAASAAGAEGAAGAGVAAAGTGVIGMIAAPVAAVVGSALALFAEKKGLDENRTALGTTTAMGNANVRGIMAVGGDVDVQKGALAAIDAQLKSYEESKKNRGLAGSAIQGIGGILGMTTGFDVQDEQAKKLRETRKKLMTGIEAGEQAQTAIEHPKPEPMKISDQSSEKIGQKLAQHLAGMRLKVEIEKMPMNASGQSGSGMRGPPSAAAAGPGSAHR